MKYMSSRKMVLLLGWAAATTTTTTAYTTNGDVVAFTNARSLSNTPPATTHRPKEAQQATRVSYSFGLGKNKPLTTTTDDATSKSLNKKHDVYEAARYWNEWETVNDYPNPNEAAASWRKHSHGAQASNNNGNRNKKTTSRPVVPSRLFDDYFPILDAPHGKVWPSTAAVTTTAAVTAATTSTGGVPTMVSSTPSLAQQFDLNTPWVEMLIHEQQVLFSSSLQ